MKKIRLLQILFIILSIFILNFSCFNRNRKPDIPPELSLKNENDKKMLVIGGKITGNWFYIFENPIKDGLDKYYLSTTFERDVIPKLKMLIKPEELPEYRTVGSELEIVNTVKDTDLVSKIFLEKNKKYGLFLFYPASAHTYPIFYFVYDGKTVKLVD